MRSTFCVLFSGGQDCATVQSTVPPAVMPKTGLSMSQEYSCLCRNNPVQTRKGLFDIMEVQLHKSIINAFLNIWYCWDNLTPFSTIPCSRSHLHHNNSTTWILIINYLSIRMAHYLLNLLSHLLITTSLCRDTFGSFDFLIDKLQIGKLEKDDNTH